MTTHRSHVIALLALTLAAPATATAAEPPALHWIAERDVTMQVDNYDPLRLFWMEPSWERMEIYAAQLEMRLAAITDGQERPRDPELERMKAELAKGTYVPHPGPQPDWENLLRGARSRPEAAAFVAYRQRGARRLDPRGDTGSERQRLAAAGEAQADRLAVP